ncbi:hypothetical protein T492DRAFT_1142378 [Pavlovales sp. CCMP2436]|nr:hypothetical protein T492DRAFT_1142378 [Pavlovales sp. CCMP2436]
MRPTTASSAAGPSSAATATAAASRAAKLHPRPASAAATSARVKPTAPSPAAEPSAAAAATTTATSRGAKRPTSAASTGRARAAPKPAWRPDLSATGMRVRASAATAASTLDARLPPASCLVVDAEAERLRVKEAWVVAVAMGAARADPISGPITGADAAAGVGTQSEKGEASEVGSKGSEIEEVVTLAQLLAQAHAGNEAASTDRATVSAEAAVKAAVDQGKVEAGAVAGVEVASANEEAAAEAEVAAEAEAEAAVAAAMAADAADANDAAAVTTAAAAMADTATATATAAAAAEMRTGADAEAEGALAEGEAQVQVAASVTVPKKVSLTGVRVAEFRTSEAVAEAEAAEAEALAARVEADVAAGRHPTDSPLESRWQAVAQARAQAEARASARAEGHAEGISGALTEVLAQQAAQRARVRANVLEWNRPADESTGLSRRSPGLAPSSPGLTPGLSGWQADTWTDQLPPSLPPPLRGSGRQAGTHPARPLLESGSVAAPLRSGRLSCEQRTNAPRSGRVALQYAQPERQLHSQAQAAQSQTQYGRKAQTGGVSGVAGGGSMELRALAMRCESLERTVATLTQLVAEGVDALHRSARAPAPAAAAAAAPAPACATAAAASPAAAAHVPSHGLRAPPDAAAAASVQPAGGWGGHGRAAATASVTAYVTAGLWADASPLAAARAHACSRFAPFQVPFQVPVQVQPVTWHGCAQQVSLPLALPAQQHWAGAVAHPYMTNNMVHSWPRPLQMPMQTGGVESGGGESRGEGPFRGGKSGHFWGEMGPPEPHKWREGREVRSKPAARSYFDVDWFGSLERDAAGAGVTPGPGAYSPSLPPARASFNVRFTPDEERPGVGAFVRAPLARAPVPRPTLGYATSVSRSLDRSGHSRRRVASGHVAGGAEVGALAAA